MENKTGKYLKYAIGEIVLVVIGILIALQINNWNDARKLKIEEQNLILDLKEEINNNIQKLEPLIERQDLITKKSTDIIENYLESKLHSTSEAIPPLFNYETIQFEKDVLNDVLGSNSRALISNKSHLKVLRKIKRTFNKVDKLYTYLDEFWNRQVTDFYYRSGVGVNLRRELTTLHETEFIIDDKFLSLLNIMNSFQKGLGEDLKNTKTVLEESLIALDNNDKIL